MRFKRTQMYRRRAVRKLLKRLFDRRDELSGVGVRVYYDPAQVRAGILWDTVDSSGDWVNEVAAVVAAMLALGYTVRTWTSGSWEARLFALVTTGNPADIPTDEFPFLP